MGANFYWIKTNDILDTDFLDREERNDIHSHIGKRSAAGLYCWDCGCTLMADATNDVHFCERGKKLDFCPGCGKEAKLESTSHTAGTVELGFSKPTDVKRTGISTASSFNWTLMKHKRRILELIEENCTDKLIINEYGDIYSPKEFMEEMLASVAMEFQFSREFS